MPSFRWSRRVEVVLPLRVDDLQHDVALDALQDRRGRPAASFSSYCSRSPGPRPRRGSRPASCRRSRASARSIEAEDVASTSRFERVEIPLLGIGRPRRRSARRRVEHAPRRAPSGSRACRRPRPRRDGSCPRESRGAARRCSRAACSSRRRTRAGVCGPRSSAPRPASARARSPCVTMPCSIGTPSSMPRRCISPEMRSDPKMRIRSSSSDR